MLVLPDGKPVSLANLYRNRSAFLACGGPSLLNHDLKKLNQRGILIMAVNNAAAIVRPHLWTCVDDPGNFCDAIWRDPTILKFAPRENFDKRLVVRNQKGELVVSGESVRQMPAVFGYARNEEFVPERFLQEETFNWGNHAKKTDADGQSGSRSVMYVALKLLFHLGIRRVYLIGCDFRMEHRASNYSFEQDRTISSVKGNNHTYEVLNVRLGRLNPYFKREGFEVFNCTPNSRLTVFPAKCYRKAIRTIRKNFPRTLNTAGMYDRIQRERDAAKTRKPPKQPKKDAAAPKSRVAPKKVNSQLKIIERRNGRDIPRTFDFFDKAYVINLAKRTDRLAHMTEGCEFAGIDFERFEAATPDHQAAFKSPGSHGCFMSHVGVWKAALAAGCKRALVMEDDVVFPENFREAFSAIIGLLQFVEWDLFHGTAIRRTRDGILRQVKRVGCSHFYIAKAASLRYLLEHSPPAIEKGMPIDQYITSMPLKKLVPPTNLTPQAVGYSDTSGRIKKQRRVKVSTIH